MESVESTKSTISIAQYAFAHTFAEIGQTCAPTTNELFRVGSIVRQVPDVWSLPISTILVDSAGCLWVDRGVDELPLQYLARDFASFRRAAELNCAASRLAFLPHSQRWQYADAEEAFLNWLRSNDRRAIDDEDSYWNELRRSAS